MQFFTKMNRLILIALLVIVTGSCIESQRPGGPGAHGTSGGNGTSGSNNTSGGAGHPGALGGPSGLGGPGGYGGSGGPSQSACSRALAPSSTEFQQLPTAVETCVAEQSGLQAIIDGLRVPDFQPRQGGGGERGCKSHDVASLLEANDYTTEATTLRKCIARELSLLAADGSFDMEALKAKILAKVTGLAVEANTQLGLDGCPEVVEYNVPEYLGCIRAYCETGAAP